MDETDDWRRIPGFSRYEINPFGHLRSLNYKGYGSIRRIFPVEDKDGYYYILLHADCGKRKSLRISRLVLLTFIGPSPEGTICAHLDGSRKNNSLENLKWVTYKENCSHRKIHGTQPYGEEHHCSKLTKVDVQNIRKQKGKETAKSVANKYGVSPSTIQAIFTGKTWRN